MCKGNKWCLWLASHVCNYFCIYFVYILYLFHICFLFILYLFCVHFIRIFYLFVLFLGRNKKLKQQALALQQEIKILSQLDHPNIIKYLGTEYSNKTMRIFLELANEGSVKDALTEFGKLRFDIIFLSRFYFICFSRFYFFFFPRFLSLLLSFLLSLFLTPLTPSYPPWPRLGPLAEPLIRRYAIDIVSGLAFLHSKRYIHRDIKPTNLLISNGESDF